MQLANFIVLFATFVVGAAAAMFTWVQTRTAVRARDDAEHARDESRKHEERVVTAQEAAAAALQRIAETAAKPRTAGGVINRVNERATEVSTRMPPWVVRAGDRRGQVRLLNNSTHAVITERVVADDPAQMKWLEFTGWAGDVTHEWEPGQWQLVENSGAGLLVAPHSITFRVEWRWADEPEDAKPRQWRESAK